MKWRSSIKRQKNDVIALFFDDKSKQISFVCFTMFDKESIDYYLDSSDGKAIAYSPSKDRHYWYLSSDTDTNLLMFRQSDSKEKVFDDVKFTDIDAFRYLISIN